MKTAPAAYFHYLKTKNMADEKKQRHLIGDDKTMKQRKTNSFMDLIRAALEAADLYKPEKEPAIYMLATLLELYQ